MTHKNAYIPSIDGLRAIAVLSVVIYHAFPKGITGGFVGVDIFFVISGYLITQILLKELAENRFSILNFYIRRINRIFPALLTVLFATLVFGWFILVKTEFVALNKHIMAGAAFASNIVLWFESGYFDVDSRYKLLLHLWSLGVEEQFYFFIPLFMYFIWKLRFSMMTMLIVLFVASFIYGHYLLKIDATAAFYNPFARAWELLAGSILACLVQDKKQGIFEGHISSLIGLILIVYAVLFYDKFMSFPGVAALVPVAGAFLLIASGENSFINKYILSNKIAVWVGLISYPLYLWHWPLLSFLQIIWQESPPHSLRFGAVLVAIILSWLTFRFVETPLKNRVKPMSLVLMMAASALIACLFYLGVINPRHNILGSEKIFEAKTGFNFPVDGTERYGDRALNYYTVKAKTKYSTLYIGDSTVQHYFPRVKHVIDSAPEKHNTAIFATMGACAPIKTYGFIAQPNVGNCIAHNEEAFKIANQPEVTKVVLGVHWIAQFIENDLIMQFDIDGKTVFKTQKDLVDDVFKRLAQQISELSKLKKVYVITASAVHPSFHPYRSLEGSRFDQMKIGTPPKPILQASFYDDYAPLHKKLVETVEAAGGIILNPLNSFCPNGFCPAVDENGEHLYADEYHLRAKTAINKAQFMDVTVQP